MPVISRFYGILIVMYFKDHNPPHFHAKYAGYEATFDFDGNITGGGLPPRADKLVSEWVAVHRVELNENWDRARAGRALNTIAPLE